MRARALVFVNAEWAVPIVYTFVKETMMDVINGAIATIIEKEIAFLSWMLNILHRLNHRDEVLECYWNARWWDMVQWLYERQCGKKVDHKWLATWWERHPPTLIWPTLPKQ